MKNFAALALLMLLSACGPVENHDAAPVAPIAVHTVACAAVTCDGADRVQTAAAFGSTAVTCIWSCVDRGDGVSKKTTLIFSNDGTGCFAPTSTLFAPCE